MSVSSGVSVWMGGQVYGENCGWEGYRVCVCLLCTAQQAPDPGGV